MKLKSFVIENLIYAAALGAALVALGIGFSLTSSTGEQSKLSYEGDLWCVSNYIEARDSQGKPIYLDDGRPRKDERLDDRTALIRKEQVSAQTKDEAENKARVNGHGLFEPSNAEELRTALDRGDEEFFKTHFNTGATSPGPCLGSGTGSGTIGSWSSQNIAEKCGLINQYTEFETVKKIRVNLTTYCPCLPSTGNTCDCALYGGSPIGGNETTADGSGMFKVIDGRLSWVKHSTGKVEKYVFAEPQSDHIIPWSQKDKLAIVIPGFNGNQPIHVRDHYAKGVHENKDFLDIFAPCNEWKPVSSALNSLSHATGGEGHAFAQVDAYVVDTTKPVSKPTTEPSKTLPDGTACPESVEPKPADGEDYQLKIAKQYEQELSRNDGVDSNTIYAPENTASNVPLFRQYDPRWGNNSYGCNGSTIRSAGCGPTAAAMVLRYYGIETDPPSLARFSLQNGYRICNSGTAWSFFAAVAKQNNLNYKSNLSQNSIIKSLQNNQPVILSMQDSIFTSKGHYIVVTGIRDGQFLINDPGPRQLSSAPISTTFQHMKNSFLIYK